MLPLSDRILLELHAGPATARDVARKLSADVGVVHRMLRALEFDRLAEERPIPRQASTWRLAPGVTVKLYPPRLEVSGVPPPAPDLGAEACHAVTGTGRRCRLRATCQGLCFLHGAREA